jgi:hypothetical protein
VYLNFFFKATIGNATMCKRVTATGVESTSNSYSASKKRGVVVGESSSSSGMFSSDINGVKTRSEFSGKGNTSHNLDN